MRVDAASTNSKTFELAPEKVPAGSASLLKRVYALTPEGVPGAPVRVFVCMNPHGQLRGLINISLTTRSRSQPRTSAGKALRSLSRRKG